MSLHLHLCNLTKITNPHMTLPTHTLSHTHSGDILRETLRESASVFFLCPRHVNPSSDRWLQRPYNRIGHVNQRGRGRQLLMDGWSRAGRGGGGARAGGDWSARGLVSGSESASLAAERRSSPGEDARDAEAGPGAVEAGSGFSSLPGWAFGGWGPRRSRLGTCMAA